MITKKQLYKLYIISKNSQQKIATKLGVSTTTIGRYLTKFNIPRRDFSDCIKNRFTINSDIAAKAKSLYDQGYNRDQIASKLNVTVHYIRRALSGRFLGYKHRSKFVVARKAHPLTEPKLQCFLGTLLGDASLIKRRGSFQYSVSHCAEQKELVEYVAKVIGSNVYLVNPSKGRYSQKQYYKTSYENKGCLEKIFKIVAKNDQKRVTEDWVSYIGPEAIAYWFMDDGSSSLMSGGFVRVSFSTLSFTLDELNLLVTMFNSFDIKSAHHKHSEPNKKGIGKTLNLSVNRENVIKFMDLIEPYIIPCMRHKIKYPVYPKK